MVIPNRLLFKAIPIVMVAWIAAAGAPFPCSAQPFDRKTLEGNRQKVIEWARLNGALIDGMTKGEVLKIYGRPDKRFNYNYQSGRLEQWVYYVPRRRSIFPFKASPFAARFRYLYFRDEILVSMQP